MGAKTAAKSVSPATAPQGADADDDSLASLAQKKADLERGLRERMREIDARAAEAAKAEKEQAQRNIKRQIEAVDRRLALATRKKRQQEDKRRNAQAFVIGRHMLRNGLDDPAVQAILSQLERSLTKETERALFGFEPLPRPAPTGEQVKPAA